MVVDEGVDVVEPDPGLLVGRGVPGSRPWARQPPPSGIRPIFLTSMCTSSPGSVTLVTHRGGLRGPDHLAGHRVALAQARDVMATQDPATPCGPGRRARGPASPDHGDARLGRRAPVARSRCWCVSASMRPRRPVKQARRRPRPRSGRPSDARTGGRHPSLWRHGRPASPARGPAGPAVDDHEK